METLDGTNATQLTGRVHSIESCGTVDGPGIRFVAFMQGCPLRCQFCHNPDTWNVQSGKVLTVDELFQEIIKYKSFMKFSNGGVTFTGGEPLLQTEYLLEVIKKCKKQGIHVALDTSGFIFTPAVQELLKYVDLVLLDIKNYDPVRYQEVTGVSLEPTLKFLNYLKEHHIPAWIRYVLIPGLTDNLHHIRKLSDFLADFDNVEKIELLPFHKMGEYKWEALGYEYRLKDTKEPGKDLIRQVREIFERSGKPVIV